MSTFILIAVTGYLAGLCGFLPGIIFSCIADKFGRRFQGSLMGFTGGLLISFICFEMLPEAFEASGLYIGVAGILAGVLSCAFLEKRILPVSQNLNLGLNNKYINTGILLAISVSLHNIPEGMAIGSLMNISVQAGMRLAVAISIHCLPEAAAVFLPFIKGGIGIKKLIAMSLLFALPICIGTVIGAVLGGISPVFISVCLGFAGGVMLYITCGEVIPSSKGVWNGRLTTILAVLGFVTGVLLTAGI